MWRKSTRVRTLTVNSIDKKYRLGSGLEPASLCTTQIPLPTEPRASSKLRKRASQQLFSSLSILLHKFVRRILIIRSRLSPYFFKTVIQFSFVLYILNSLKRRISVVCRNLYPVSHKKYRALPIFRICSNEINK